MGRSPYWLLGLLNEKYVRPVIWLRSVVVFEIAKAFEIHRVKNCNMGSGEYPDKDNREAWPVVVLDTDLLIGL
jgi:hypothetical protein